LTQPTIFLTTNSSGNQRLRSREPKQLFPLGGSSSFLGAIYWEPIGNGQRFVELRSASVTGRDNRINVIIN
jgi:hypothetical protein